MVPSPVDVTISGEWAASIPPNRRWAGELRADRPFVTLLLARTPHRVLWAKTRVCPSAETHLLLDIHPLRWSSPETQILFHAHDGHIGDLVVSLAPPGEVREALSSPSPAHAGALLRVFDVISEPPASLEIVILAREDVRVSRSGVWRPRKDSLLALPAPVMHALDGGRSGALDSNSTESRV